MTITDSKPIQPRNFCSRKKFVIFCIVIVVLLVYFSSTSNLFQTVSLYRPNPDSEPVPHHYIGYKDLAPYPVDSSATPCEHKEWHTQRYNVLSNDTIIVLHIQKTGGSDFLRHLVTVQRDNEFLCNLPDYMILRIDKRMTLPKGKQRVSCPKLKSDPQSRQWLLSEKTLGWKCGVHPSLTEYKNCEHNLDVGEGSQFSQYRYLTILRNPILRFMSEFEHVSRGARWSMRKKCGGERVTDSDMPPCYPGYYDGKQWPALTLSDFLACESNWARNRQVMWLADLESVGCYDHNTENRDEKLLASAKCNLEKMSFFGLTEYQKETSVMFEKVFNVTFSAPLRQYNMTYLHTAPILRDIWKKNNLYDKIASANHLDMQLYEHALRLFARRAKAFGLDIDLQKVDKNVHAIRDFNINMTAKKFTKGIFDLT